MTQHAQLGASSSERWLNCPGSVKRSDGKGGTRSVYAAEGSAAHTLAETLLQAGGNAEDHLGQEIEGFEVDEDMARAVQVYVDDCRRDMKGADRIWIEQRVALDKLWTERKDDPPAPLFGTADFGAYFAKQRALLCRDYKHGKGVAVEVKDNPQLLYYALGLYLLIKDELPVRHILLEVCQPRAYHSEGKATRRDVWTVADLLMWAEIVLVPGVETALNADAVRDLNTGDWCRWCPAQACCPALREAALYTARMDFDDDEPAVSPTDLDDIELAHVLNQAEIIQSWVSQVRAEASARIDRGAEVPGWKLVPKRAMRRWTGDLADVQNTLEQEGMSPDDFIESKLRSPAQIEKKNKQAYKAVESFVSKESSGTTLVQDTDDRPAARTGPAADFNE